MTDITIPSKALRAARLASMNALGDGEDAIEAACIAMLKAWPGMEQVPPQYGDRVPPVIILPLTETTNDKA